MHAGALAILKMVLVLQKKVLLVAFVALGAARVARAFAAIVFMVAVA
jgi:hypothetical protein